MLTCQVVVDLIMEMKRLGHPSFINLDNAKVQEKAAELPEDGVPPEVLSIIEEEMGNDDAPMDSKLQPQKAATPCDAPELDIAAAGKTFAAQRPRTVVAEGQDQRDAQEAEKLALENLVADLKDDGIRAGLETYEVRAGNQLMDMFRPGYWAIAYCFLFKHGTAGPDVVNTIKTEQAEMEPSRRKKGNERAPEVGIQAWAASMQRQAAAQFRRDWNFSPTLWNYLFRTRINLEPNAYMFMKLDEDGGGRRMMTIPEIQAATQEVYRQLYLGTYLDTNNELKPVNGDLNKVSYVPGLSVGAHHVLNNLQARTRKVPGTHAVRSTMRHQTHANRICYGTPLFITFSSSEKDSALAICMGRVRQSDPAIAGDDNKSIYSREKPELDVEFCCLSPERLAEDFGFYRAGYLYTFLCPSVLLGCLHLSVCENFTTCPARSYRTTKPGGRYWRGTRWHASTPSMCWSAWLFGTSSASSSAPSVRTAPARTIPAWMHLAAALPRGAASLVGSMRSMLPWNVNAAVHITYMGNSSWNAFTSSDP